MNAKALVRSARRGLEKHAPDILIATGIAGFFGTIVAAVYATPKALEKIEDRKEELSLEKLSAGETIKAAWVCYIPTAISAVSSATCIILAGKLSAKKSAALMTAYTLSESALNEYKAKVVEQIGEAKEREIRSAIAKDHVDRDKPIDKEVVILDDDKDILTLISYSGRYCKSNITSVREAVVKLNALLQSDGFVSLNEFYYELGMKEVSSGDEIGWDIRKTTLIRVDFSSALDENMRPCLAVEFITNPEPTKYLS